MKIQKIARGLALLLCAVLLLSLCSCAKAGDARPNGIANKVVATAGNVEIYYDSLYFITMTRIKEMKTAYGENVFDDPGQVTALQQFVQENLLTESEALISLAKDHGIEVDQGDVGAAVQERMEQIMETVFENDRDAYIESLNAEYLTDRYVRTYLAVEENLAEALVNQMLQSGEIPDDDATASALIHSDDMVRTVHVFIDRYNGKSDEENRANITAVWQKIAAAADKDARIDAMNDAIGGVYNEDYGDTLGNGYYIARGEADAAYEAAAFQLPDFGVSDVVETADGYYVIMRKPKDDAYINANFESLKQKTYYVTLNGKVNERLAAMELNMTDFGRELDLLDLPEVDADGGEVLFWVSVSLCGIIGVGAVVAIVWLVVRKLRQRKAK